MLNVANHIHPRKWSNPMIMKLEEGCHRQHNYRVERRLKINEIKI